MRRTEDIQSQARRELIELQQASLVAQSKTLGDYLLEFAGLKRKAEVTIDSAEPHSVRDIDRPFGTSTYQSAKENAGT